MKKALFLLISIVISFHAITQVVYEDINNLGIYEFLDELASLKIIEINSVVKPYSRKFIAEKLLEANKRTSRQAGKKFALNKRQRKELNFYIQDYQIDLRCGIREKQKAKSEIDNQQPTTDCPIEYDHKLGSLFKKKPAFAVPLNPLAFQYKGRLFTFSARPTLGITYMVNENGSAMHKYWGGSMFGYIGRNFGFYASLTDL